MKDHLRALKQRAVPPSAVPVTALLAFVLCLSACSGNAASQDTPDAVSDQLAPTGEPSAIFYVNDRLGFSMELPSDWMGQVEIGEEYDLPHQNGGSCITFYHKPTRDSGNGGVLFYIDCYSGKWSEDDPPVIAGHSIVAAQTEDRTYLLRTPSDVEYSESDPALAEAYQSLAAQQDFIIAHIRASGQTASSSGE